MYKRQVDKLAMNSFLRQFIDAGLAVFPGDIEKSISSTKSEMCIRDRHYKQPAGIREAQLKTWLSGLENIGMAVVTDAADSTDIHPRNKVCLLYTSRCV